LISIDPSSQTERDNYRLLTSSIIPRPVAFVTSMSPEGAANAAPFSYFNIVAANPPMISISVQRKAGSIQKDTARNIETVEAFVVHITDEKNINAVNKTAANLAFDESEIDYAGLTPVNSDKIAVPGIQEAAVRMECVLERIIPLGGTALAPACDLIIGRVVCFHFSEDIYTDGNVDYNALKPISRLGGIHYSKLGDVFSLERPE
jgi:flavin reductase (DIM6/NTAB) family NADH-FMN oxidoreductase RutF